MDHLEYVSNGSWGTGLGRPLHAAEFDGNNWTIEEAVNALEASIPAAARGIVSTAPSGSSIIITYTDATTDTIPLPVPEIDFLDSWQPLTDYTGSVGALFTAIGALYQIIYPHVSAATFDPGANDGMGHDFYKLGFALPAIHSLTQSAATLTLSLDLANTYNRCTNAAGCDVTVPPNSTVPFAIDTEVHFKLVEGSGAVLNVIEGAGVTIDFPEGFLSHANVRGAVITLKKVDTNVWDMFGMLAPA
jgi:hypothetical protein